MSSTNYCGPATTTDGDTIFCYPDGTYLEVLPSDVPALEQDYIDSLGN